MNGKDNQSNNKKQDTSVSFSKDCNEINITPDEYGNEDDIQISLEPYIQVYLAQSSQRVQCCGFSFPIPFERAATSSWWDPRFDSEILEGQYKLSAFPQIRLRFRYSLLYIFVVSLIWCVYLTIKAVVDEGRNESFSVALIFGSFSIFTLFILLFTKSNLYTMFHIPVSIMTTVVMFALSLMSIGTTSVLTPIGDFSLCLEILMIMYTVIPLPLYLCVLLGIFYSFLFEFFISSLFFMPARILCHICVHLMGIHILLMTHVRMRGTFMKVGQSLLVRRQLEMEKQLKEKMIHSVMPPKVVDWLMSEGAASGREEEVQNLNKTDIRSIFRPFNMHRMEDVSILFADIVGFTKMSSSKTAEQLVAILNDLFARFDELCLASGCEKISTLGDCYYCVSGCPEPRPDHAHCCVQMGLGMIDAITRFDEERNEGVNMRVGIHTGTVLCGIVGTKRVKFDVWSNDVTLANKMESTSKPGKVHLTSKTKEFLDDRFILEEGEPYLGMSTYFVKGRKDDEMTKNKLAVPSLQANQMAEPRKSSISLATAISLHINQTAALEEVLSIRTPSPGSEQQCNTYKFFSAPQIITEGMNNTATLSPVSRAQSPVEQVLQMSNSWKTTSMPSILDMEPSDRQKPSYKEFQIERESDDAGKEPLVKSQNTIDTMNMAMRRDDQTSVSMSMNSRKDSGIRSNSRKSSIQHPLRASNGPSSSDLYAHRVSGYFTSSQSSVNNEETLKRSRMITSTGDQYGVSFQKLRKQSDLQLIRCVQDNSQSQRSYFVKPPLCSISLFFRQKDMEREYRLKTHRSCDDEAMTLATARFNTHLDIAVAIVVFFLVSLSCLLLFDITSMLLLLFLLLCAVQSIALFLCLRSVFWPESNSSIDPCFDWYCWHMIGGVLVSLPIVVIFLSLNEALKTIESLYYFTSLFFVGIIHFCNFTQLNCWMKSSMATIAGLIYLFIIVNYFKLPYVSNVGFTNSSEVRIKYPVPFSDLPSSLLKSINHSNSNDQLDNLPIDVRGDDEPFSPHYSVPITHPFSDNTIGYSSWLASNFSVINSAIVHSNKTFSQDGSYSSAVIFHEVYVDVILILFLVWFLNREFEISYRLSFHGNVVAARDKTKVQMMRDQAELLLHNIIPKHVAEHLKTTATYSENVHNAGIIFASIINFSDMYDESYLGGRECLRVLNELVSDFDELLEKPEFASVEKIKTIGSTYMAASGLNSNLYETAGKHDHLYTLLEFAQKLQAVVDAFNKDLLEFNLILRIGYCHGDITAGVIGTTKLYYDIWGDAVNIASRMDSTGVAGRIQVPAFCVPALDDYFQFEKRGQVYVKGKDNMAVHLLVGKK